VKFTDKPERAWRLLRTAERRLPARARHEFDENLTDLLVLLHRQLVTSRRSQASRRPVTPSSRNRRPR
jgi:hypothetical protein